MDQSLRDDELPDSFEVDVAAVPSAVLRQLIEEVRHDADGEWIETVQAYNRTHNRHNRGVGRWPGDTRPGGYNRTHNRHNRGR